MNPGVRFLKKAQQELQTSFESIDLFPSRYHVRIAARARWKARFDLEPVLEIMYGRQRKFWCIFYVLDRRFPGQYGICSDDVCVRHHVQWGSFEMILPHIRGTLSWLESLTENPFTFPAERSYDAVTDILSRINSRCLAHGWHRYYAHAGTFEQFVTFNEVNGVEGNLEASFGKEHWHIYFELTACGENDLSPLERQQVMTIPEFTPQQAASAADFISAALARRTLKTVSL